MRTATLFTLFAAQAHANSTLTAHRKLQGGCGDVFTRVTQVNAACCPSGGAGGGHRRTQTCSPTTCSSLCATVFVPFLDDCGGILVAGGQYLTQFFGLYYSCRQAAPSARCGAGAQHLSNSATPQVGGGAPLTGWGLLVVHRGPNFVCRARSATTMATGCRFRFRLRQDASGARPTWV
jgi:hypothetical protein